MTTAKLMAELDEARFVRYDPDADLLLVWFGGHGVHVYDDTGTEVDYYSVGDFASNDAALPAVRQSMVDWIATR